MLLLHIYVFTTHAVPDRIVAEFPNLQITNLVYILAAIASNHAAS
jgi:hypothetical protein